MNPPHFHCATIPPPGAEAVLSAEEFRHVTAARRLRAGDEITLCDGRGTVAAAVIEDAAGRGTVHRLRILRRHAEPPPAREWWLACALPKGDRQATLVEMATQLGMNRFTALECERSVAPASESVLGRLRRVAGEAGKQSRRAWYPVVDDRGMRLADFLAAPALQGSPVIAPHPGAPPLRERLAAGVLRGARTVVIVVGPEGGFSESEVAALVARGAVTAGLGDNILRTETAAVATLAALRLAVGDG